MVVNHKDYDVNFVEIMSWLGIVCTVNVQRFTGLNFHGFCGLYTKYMPATDWRAPGFLKSILCRLSVCVCVCVCVCVHPWDY